MTDPTAFLESLASNLDISETLYEEAVERYLSVGNWLSRPESPVAGIAHIRAHGSFDLGTVIRPAQDHEEYDIDLVAQINRSKNSITQIALKELVGSEIEQYHTQYRFLEPVTEDDFCWTLRYADAATFKMDIVPALPEASIPNLTSNENLIAITDRTNPFYKIITPNWTVSNPFGYGEWFRSRMRFQMNEQRAKAAKLAGKSVSDIPEHRIKTPLQRAVQLLKRYRNVMFKDGDNAPSSILITTLAAQIYANEADLVQALINIISNIRFAVKGGVVLNPVDPAENLIKSWSEDPDKELAFNDLCSSLESDFVPAIQNSLSSSELQQRGGKMFGESVVEKSIRQNTGGKLPQIMRFLPKPLPTVFKVPHRVWPPFSFKYEHECTVSAVLRKSDELLPVPSDELSTPKYADLDFSVSTDTPPPFDIHYQVVNTGEEAKRANQMRGGIVKKHTWLDQKISHSESTKFAGKHYIEFFIVKQGTCVARSGPFIVNIV